MFLVREGEVCRLAMILCDGSRSNELGGTAGSGGTKILGTLPFKEAV